MPLPAIDPAVQRVAIIRQLAPGAERPPLGSLPPLEDAPAGATKATRPSGASKWAKMLWGGGVGADVATTANNIAHGGHETNPMVNFAGDKMAIPIMLAGEAGSYAIAKKLLGNRHPKMMNAILAGSGLLHGGAALYNTKKPSGQDTSTGAVSVSPYASHPNLIQGPDGFWIDPSVVLPSK